MQKIMFNDRYGLTEAVLSGGKTQTRRIELLTEYERMKPKVVDNKIVLFNDFGEVIFRKPTRYKVGEVVAVAQSYKDAGYNRGTYWDKNYRDENNRMPIFMANEEPVYVDPAGWNNKMFVRADLMPEHIKMSGIRFERLQDISDEDCIKEGIEWCPNGFYVAYNASTGSRIWLGNTPREAYAALIDKISGRGTWERNPFVVVYDYKKM